MKVINHYLIGERIRLERQKKNLTQTKSLHRTFWKESGMRTIKKQEHW